MKAKSAAAQLILAVLIVISGFALSYLDTYYLSDRCYIQYYQGGSYNGYCLLGFNVVRPLQFILLHPVLILGLLLSPLKISPIIFLLLTPVILGIYWFFMLGLISRLISRFSKNKRAKR